MSRRRGKHGTYWQPEWEVVITLGTVEIKCHIEWEENVSTFLPSKNLFLTGGTETGSEKKVGYGGGHHAQVSAEKVCLGTQFTVFGKITTKYRKDKHRMADLFTFCCFCGLIVRYGVNKKQHLLRRYLPSPRCWPKFARLREDNKDPL